MILRTEILIETLILIRWSFDVHQGRSVSSGPLDPLQNSEWSSLGRTSWIGMGPLTILGVQFEKWTSKMGPFFFFQFTSPFLGSKDMESWKHEKNSGSIKIACCLKHVFFWICFLSKDKCTLQKWIHFFENGSSSFLECVFHHLRDAQKKWVRIHFGVCLVPIWGSSGQFGNGGVDCKVLVFSVSWSVKWHVNDVFLRCVFERHDVKSHDHSVILGKTAFGGNASLWPADPCIALFLEHPRPMIHAGVCPQFYRIDRRWILNELGLELVQQNKV